MAKVASSVEVYRLEDLSELSERQKLAEARAEKARQARQEVIKAKAAELLNLTHFNLTTEALKAKAREIENERQAIAQWYEIAFSAVYKRIPERDAEDIIQEIVLAYVEKGLSSGFLLYLIAKEKVTQYWRQGKIGDRNYRNIMLTRSYYQKKRQKVAKRIKKLFLKTLRLKGKKGKKARITLDQVKRVPNKEQYWLINRYYFSGHKLEERIVFRTKYKDYDQGQDLGEYVVIPAEDIGDNGEQVEMMENRIFLSKAFIESLPNRHKELVAKKLNGEALTDSERALLSRYQRRLAQSFLT